MSKELIGCRAHCTETEIYHVVNHYEHMVSVDPSALRLNFPPFEPKRDLSTSVGDFTIRSRRGPYCRPHHSLGPTALFCILRMATEAPDPKTFEAWEDAFKYAIPAVRRMEQQLRSEISGNRERLRTLVGWAFLLSLRRFIRLSAVKYSMLTLTSPTELATAIFLGLRSPLLLWTSR